MTTMTYGEWRVSQGRKPECNGSQNVVPVPIDMTLDDVLDELTTMGQLTETPADDEDVEWAVVECPGWDDCWCQHGLLDPNFRAFNNDVQVYGPPQEQN